MSVPLTTVYVARHGQSEWNHRRRVTGQLDPALSSKGEAQSRAIADCLEAAPVAAIYTSALRRTQETARPTSEAKGIGIHPVPALNEIDLGVLQGRFRDERDPQAQAMWSEWHEDMFAYRVPGGESFDDLRRRVSQALRGILAGHAGQTLLIVGHRGTNRVLMGTLLNWPVEQWPSLRLRSKFLYRVRIGAATEIATITLTGEKKGTSRDGFVM